MCSRTEEPILFYHGWDHVWCNPKNLFIKQFIKGPFLKPKILLPLPYITLCQKDGDPLLLNRGIPDCWAEYLTHNFIPLCKHLEYYELMQKEDVEIVPQLRKNYRLYIGQGIPDPWTSFPIVDNPKIVARNSSKEGKKNLLCLSNSKKDNCYCCEKKYLFDCPDKATLNNCTCRDCHTRNETLATDYPKNCKCISLFRDWVLKNTESRRRKKQRRKKERPRSDLSSSSNSRTEDECPNVAAEFCECLRRVRPRSDLTGSDTEENANARRKTFPKDKSKGCHCPYVKTVYVKNFSANKGNLSQCLKTSKQSQTENLPSKDSKIVQTDKSKLKPQSKCKCGSKCPHCNFYHCKASWTKMAYPAVPNACFSSNHAIICPYSFPNHFVIQKPSKHDEVKKLSKKHQKIKINEEESNGHSKPRHKESKPNEEIIRKGESQGPETDPHHFDKSNAKDIYYCQTFTKDFPHFNNSSERKHYLVPEERPPGISNFSNSRFVNFCRGDSSTFSLNQEKYQTDRFKDFPYYKPKYFKYGDDSKMMYLRDQKYDAPKKPFNSCDQATMTVSAAGENTENDFNKLKYLGNLNDSELKTLYLIKNWNESYRANRRRRKLLTNRKRRRKLITGGKSNILEYQALLKQYERPELVNKEVQVEGTNQNQFSTRLYENNASPSKNLRFSENTTTNFKDVPLNISHLIAGTLDKIEETSKGHLGNSSKVTFLGEVSKQSLRSDPRFNKTLEGISKTSKNTWTSTALKNIVDDLLTNKKSNEINVKV